MTKVHLFLLQILQGNIACAAMSQLSDVLFSGAGYCKRRMRLSVTLFAEKEYLPQKTMEFIFWSYFSSRVICVFHGKKLRERIKGAKLIFGGGES